MSKKLKNQLEEKKIIEQVFSEKDENQGDDELFTVLMGFKTSVEMRKEIRMQSLKKKISIQKLINEALKEYLKIG